MLVSLQPLMHPLSQNTSCHLFQPDCLPPLISCLNCHVCSCRHSGHGCCRYTTALPCVLSGSYHPRTLTHVPAKDRSACKSDRVQLSRDALLSESVLRVWPCPAQGSPVKLISRSPLMIPGHLTQRKNLSKVFIWHPTVSEPHNLQQP